MSIRTSMILAALSALLLATPAEAASCSDPSGVCVADGKGKFEADASLSAKAMKAKRKGPACKVSFEIDGGRGSVFVNGRYVGTAPVQSVTLLPGKHDIQVRDGQKILAEGVLTVPKGGTMQVTINHG